jgi:hypothetical protein
MADAFEPYFLLSKHHEAEPEQTLATAVLLLTDARWRKGASHLVRRIADGGLLDEEQLDLLARTFLAAEDAVYWTVPADWFATVGIEIALDVAVDEEDEEEEDEDEEDEDGPVVARRELAPPRARPGADDVGGAARPRARAERASWGRGHGRDTGPGRRPGRGRASAAHRARDHLAPPQCPTACLPAHRRTRRCHYRTRART